MDARPKIREVWTPCGLQQRVSACVASVMDFRARRSLAGLEFLPFQRDSEAAPDGVAQTSSTTYESRGNAGTRIYAENDV